MELETGSYEVGYFRGISSRGNFSNLNLASREDAEAFVSTFSVRKFNAETGEPTVPESVGPGDLVAVRVRLEIQPYDEKLDGVPTGKTKSFIKKSVLSVVAL